MEEAKRKLVDLCFIFRTCQAAKCAFSALKPFLKTTVKVLYYMYIETSDEAVDWYARQHAKALHIAVHHVLI